MIEGRGTEMPQQPGQFQEQADRPVPVTTRGWGARAVRLLGIIALGTMLAACGRCGDFLSSDLGQIGACHSDAPRQQ
jgi:hypothetical protein